MKKIFTYSIGALFLASALSLGSCKSQADDDLTRRTEQSINQGTPVVFTFDMESLPEQDARALTIESQTSNGQNAGLKQVWAEGDTETIHLLFKQGTKKEVVTTKIKIGAYNASSKRYEGKFEATPTTINLAAGNVTVAGVMGVSELKDTGEATISSSKFFGEADSFTTLPMYFTERPVTSNGSSYVADMSLHFFGSVVGVTVSNVGGNMTYSPHEVTFKTGAFTTEGTMNILAASEANSATGAAEVLPTWTSTQTATTEQRVDFDHGDIKVGTKKTLFFWVHPSTYTGTKTLKLDVRTDNFDDNLGATDPEVTKNFNVKPLSQRRVHRIAEELKAPKGDLIISEVYMGLLPANTLWEIYNPTEETIDLTPYTMQRFDLNGSSYPSTPTYESKLTDSHLWLKTLHGAATTKLGPHKTILYWSASTGYYSEVEQRPGVVYIANYAVTGAFGLNKQKNDYGQAFRVPQYSRHALAKNGKIVDNFFYGDGTTKYKIPAGNFMRKPGRNLPRTQMKIDIKNSDWVVRDRTAREDLGYRYSYYYDRSRKDDDNFYGNHWLEDTQNKGTGDLKGNPIKNVDYTVDATRSTSDASTKGKYTPPTWWTKARAQAADK
ncbi:lamin tail domain-containing protein [Porphyromonas bobii]|uniref:lamin tail domain-containing protein n=1 Tax=Porphyromonas bobii TaxID=2811780 RepID=UPI001C001C62|nr:lamin tail domain-containing protein [Porphyromonas bobii]